MLKVYLDQNVISSLRDRKGQEEPWAKALSEALLHHNCIIHYSTYTLNEISQSNDAGSYLNVLKNLDAKYCFIYENIERMDVDDKSVEDIWEEYLVRNKEMSDLGIDVITDSAINCLKIISGCNTGRDLYEGFHDFINQTAPILQQLISTINDFLPLSERLECDFKKSAHQSAGAIDHLKGVNHTQLHPGTIRRYLKIEKEIIESLNLNELELILRQLSTEEIFNERKDKKALFIYLALNLIGYHSDDYTRKRGKRLIA